MAVWRRKLIELFPDDSSYWESCEYVSIAFGLLNSNLERYVAQGDADSTKRVFDFAEWAYSEKALNNSVCTGFYEGLPRNEKLQSNRFSRAAEGRFRRNSTASTPSARSIAATTLSNHFVVGPLGFWPMWKLNSINLSGIRYLIN